MEHHHFYHALVSNLSGLVVSVSGQIVFMPADGDCLHVIESAQVTVIGEPSLSMQAYLEAELARRQALAGGAQ